MIANLPAMLMQWPRRIKARGSFFAHPPSSLRLLPVEILVPEEDSTSSGFSDDLVSTDKLKVAKWEDAFQGTSQSPQVKPDFNEGDVDRFYLKVPMPWKEGEGTSTVKIKTDSDPENEIEVTEIPSEPGVFRTNGLILVSNDVDDAHPPNTDEQPSDVTHKVKLGDTVTFTISPPSGPPITIEAEVPVRKKLTLNVWRMNVPGVRSPAQVDSAVKRIKETYAQVGLEIEANVTSRDWPQAVEDLKAGTNRANSPGFLKIYDAATGQKGPFTDEYETFIDSFPANGSSEVDLYFLKAAYGSFGIAVTINDLPEQDGDTSYEYVDKAFVHDANSPRSQTPPHEILHVLAPESPSDTDMPHYQNVLSYGGGGDDTVFGRRRIFKEQEEMIDGHPSVKEP